MTPTLTAGTRDGTCAPRLAIVYEPIDRLKCNPQNARTHGKRQIEKIAASVREFGMLTPILIDAGRNVISGHARLSACRRLGLTEVPVVRVEHLSPAQVQAFAIADNRLAELAGWDDQLLREQLRLLSQVNLEFDLTLTGFEVPEIDLLLSDDAVSGVDPADEAIPCSSGPAISRPGDLWVLDRHRVYCGSALDPAAYQALMGEKRAAVVFADAPYNVKIHGHASGLGRIRHREFVMGSGEMSPDQFTEFLTTACGLFASHSCDGALHYLCMDWRHLYDLLTAAKKIYSELKNICIWVKDGPGMGSLYRSQHEMIVVFKNGQGRHQNHIQLRRFGRNRPNIWRYPCARSFSRGEEGNLLAAHPTVKPVRLVADALLDSSAKGEIVLDGFLGSGSTLIAAQRVGRRCYGLELDPLYVDTAIQRWQADTGNHAMHAETRRTFDETGATRGDDNG